MSSKSGMASSHNTTKNVQNILNEKLVKTETTFFALNKST